MNAKAVTTAVQQGQEAARSFLSNTLGVPVSLDTVRPVEESFVNVKAETASHVVVHASAVDSALVLEAQWIPLLSHAVLGEERPESESAAADLVVELATEGYRLLQQQMAQTGAALPETSFVAYVSDGDVPPLPDQLWKVPFSASIKDQRLSGYVLLPFESSAPTASTPEAQSAPPPQPAQEAPANQQVEVAPAAFSDLGTENIDANGGGNDFDLLADVELEVTVELGRRRLPLADLLHLTTGSVVELEKLVGEPLEVYANGRLIAEGEAVVIDEQFGVRITNLTSERQRKKAFM